MIKNDTFCQRRDADDFEWQRLEARPSNGNLFSGCFGLLATGCLALLIVVLLSSCAVATVGETRVVSMGGRMSVDSPQVRIESDHTESFGDATKVASRLITWNGISSVVGSAVSWLKVDSVEDAKVARQAISNGAKTDQLKLTTDATTETARITAESSRELAEINAGLERISAE